MTARQAGNSRPVQVLAALLESGWEIDVVAPAGSYLDAEAPEAAREVQREGGLRIHRIESPGGSGGYRSRSRSYADFSWRSLSVALRLPRPSLVYCSSPPLPQALPALLLAALRRAPVVFEVRDLWPAMLVEAGLIRSPFSRALLAWLEATAARDARLCVPVTPAFGRYLEVLGVPPDRIHVAPTGADGTLAGCPPGAGEEWRRSLGLQERIVLLYTGSMNEHYGVRDVLRAAEIAHARDPRLAWVFFGEGRDRRLVTEAARRHDCVWDQGPVAKNDLLPALHGADVGVVHLERLPLFRTVLPGKLFDYMAAGLPVLSTIPGHAEEIVRASGAGMHCGAGAAGIPEDLAAGALALAGLPAEERRARGRRGQQWALLHVNAAACARELASALDPLAGGPTTPRGAGLLHLATSAAAGLADVVRGRPGAAHRALLDPSSLARTGGTLDAWLRARSGGASRAPLAVPRILSDPEAREPGPEPS